MKKNQGAKTRKTHIEAARGPDASYADGLVGFFIVKKIWYLSKCDSLKALETLQNPSDVQQRLLPKLRKEVKSLGEELGYMIAHAPQEHPQFLTKLAEAEAVSIPAYPAEVKMLEIFTQRAVIENKPLTQDELWRLLIDSGHHCERAKFDGMLTRYALKNRLGKGRAGRARK